MMICLRGVTTSLILGYLGALLLLTGLLSTDAKPISPRTLGSDSYQFSANQNTLTSHIARRGLHADGIHQSRRDVALLGERSLVKRGNCMSSKAANPTWTCSGQTPSVAECVSQIRSHGQVGPKISVFYTALGGASGLRQCKQYFTCNPQIGAVVLWDDIVDPTWFRAQGQAIAQANPNANPSLITDPFAKRMSQAFAEASRGDAYICTPASNAPNNDFNQDMAWGGWEYPALTRNGDVTRIIRVDPATGVTQEIWRQGDPATPNAPKG